MYEITNVFFPSILMEKLPSRSVIVPLVVLPFSTTEAPITGSPLVSFTLPFTVIVCADTLSDIAANSINSKVRMFSTLLDILCMFINSY